MKSILASIAVLLLTANLSIGQHHYDDTFTAQRAESYTIDGVGDESFWDACEWYGIDYVWIPFGEAMSDGDFSGRVKFAWTEDELLILAEIEDNELSDDHEAPFDNYWNDDCFEVFLDEDYSGGWHQDDYNAFAYHCAINEQDVIDIGISSNVNLQDHVEYDLDTIDATNYIWELAITIYDDTYDEDSETNNTVTLTAGKEMGIAIAYCDNDETSSRENFIGCVNVASEHFNSAWQDADVFGRLTLVGEGTDLSEGLTADNLSIYFTQDQHLVIKSEEAIPGMINVSVYDLNGRLMNSSSVCLDGRVELDVHDLVQGLYIVRVHGDSFSSSSLLQK